MTADSIAAVRHTPAATRITPARWQEVRIAVARVCESFAAMVRSAPSSGRTMATAEWTVSDTAAHVTAISFLYSVLIRQDGTPRPLPGLQDTISATTVDNIGVLNEQVLSLFTDRDPEVLATRLGECVSDILASTQDLDPSGPVGWLGGSTVPRAGIVAHLLNELLIHGRDIARALGRPWTIRPADAALFFELFLVELIRNDTGKLLDNDEPPHEQRIAVRFRSRHTRPVTLVLHRGEVSAQEPAGDDDIKLRFDPAALNLMLFHRVGAARTALAGKVAVWGRRPWLLPRFLRTVRLP